MGVRRRDEGGVAIAVDHQRSARLVRHRLPPPALRSAAKAYYRCGKQIWQRGKATAFCVLPIYLRFLRFFIYVLDIKSTIIETNFH